MNDVLNKEKIKILFLLLFLMMVQIHCTKMNFKEINKLKDIYRKNSVTINISDQENNVVFDIGKPNIPLKKLNNTEEALIPILSITANSTYTKLDENKNIIKKYDAKNLLSEEYWCSSGNHGTRELISLKFQFETSTRLSAIWLHWAYAPGEFRIRYTNIEEDESTYKEIFPTGFRYSIEKGNLNWWKKILSNPKTRWQHKSFDDRIDLDVPVFARYVEMIMRIPVNQYFGLYKIEFYRNVKSVVMIKSQMQGRNICMALANGEYLSGTPILAKGCLDSLSLADNRDLFILNSNGLITSYQASSRCIQSPLSGKVELENCSTAEEYKDDRHKWNFEYTGLIRSVKDPLSCLSININNDNFIHPDQMTVKASSTEPDNIHKPEFSINYSTENYWASEPTSQDVVYFISFNNNLSFLLKSTKIEWKFPAKDFRIMGLLSDGNWKDYYSITNNRDIITEHSLLNSELKGIKLVMKEASMRVEGKSIYAISNVFLNLAGSYIVRQQCSQMIDNVNLWELIDITYRDVKKGLAFKKEFSKLQQNINALKKIQKLYEEIPTKLSDIMGNSDSLQLKLKEIDEKMSGVKFRMLTFESLISSLGDAGKKSNILGDSFLFPAMDCTHIKIAFPHKRSGFYWIKNECMNKSHKIFCDFYKNKHKDNMAFDFNIISLDVSKNNFSFIPDPKKAKSEEFVFEIKRKCAEFGLEPLEIKTLKSLKRLQFLISTSDFNFGMGNKLIFPIAFAYDEDNKSALGKKFNSLNKSNSYDIRNIANLDSDDDPVLNLKTDNVLKLLFENIAVSINSKVDVIAFSSEMKLIYTRFQNAKINGIVCSSNQLIKINPTAKFSHSPELKCDTTFKTDPFTGKENITSIIVKCPGNCAALNGASIYGKGPYTDHSSICRAAIHSGVIRDFSGGEFVVNLMPGLSSYEGSDANQVESLDYKKQHPRSFVIAPHKFVCPTDNLEGELNLYQNSLITKGKKDSRNASRSESTDFSSFLSLDEIANLSNSTADNINDESKDEIRLLLRFLQNKSSSNKLLLSNNQNKDGLNSLVTYTQPHKDLTTDEAMIEVDSNLKASDRVLQNAYLLSDQLKKLVSQVQTQLVIYKTDSTIGINGQLDYFHSQGTKVEDVKKIIFDLDNIFMLKLIKAEHNFYELKREIDGLQKRENFQEDFTNESILTNYKIFNSVKGVPKQKPAEWSYFQYNLQGHNKVIVQRNRFTDERTGSHLIIKNRDFYDFEFRCSVYIGKPNMDTFGVAFRYLNEFTHYVFEMSRQEKGYKRLRRFIKGTPTILDFKFDGGYNNDEWIFLKIRAEVGSLKIYMTSSDEEMVNIREIDSRFVLVFDIYDNTLPHGTIAITSSGLNFVLIDDVTVVQISCTDFLSSHISIDSLSNNCNRYRENFRHLPDKYKLYDPIKYEDGPSYWIRTRNYENRRVLEQTSRIHGISQQEEGTIYLLIEKVCVNGQITVKAKAVENMQKDLFPLTNTSVGIVFKFVDENNYYVLEIFKDSIRLRKKVEGVFQLIKMNSTVGYQVNSWFKIILVLKVNRFNALFFSTVEKNIPVKVFAEDAFDNTFKTGQVGLWTFRTAAVFSAFETDPFEGTDSSNKILLVDEHKIEKNDLIAFKNLNNMNDTPSNSSSDPNKYQNVINTLNKNIPNFSWKTCLYEEDKEKRTRMCSIIFNGEDEISKCSVKYLYNFKNNFCGSCCPKYVELGNNNHKFLCTKQCKMFEQPMNDFSSFETCIDPVNPGHSSYNYCDKLFQFDFHQRNQCKNDMCKICCVAYDASRELEPYQISDNVFQMCQTKCSESKLIYIIF